MTTTFRWGLYDREPLTLWSQGRLTLLGDVAHAMLPYMSQGANQAIEDAMALATLLQQAGPADVPNCLRRYQDLRHDRTAVMHRVSRINHGFALGASQPWARDYDVQAAALALSQDAIGCSAMQYGLTRQNLCYRLNTIAVRNVSE